MAGWPARAPAPGPAGPMRKTPCPATAGLQDATNGHTMTAAGHPPATSAMQDRAMQECNPSGIATGRTEGAGHFLPKSMKKIHATNAGGRGRSAMHSCKTQKNLVWIQPELIPLPDGAGELETLGQTAIRLGTACLFLRDRMQRCPLFPLTDPGWTCSHMRSLRSRLYLIMGIQSAHKFLEHLDKSHLIMLRARAS